MSDWDSRTMPIDQFCGLGCSFHPFGRGKRTTMRDAFEPVEAITRYENATRRINTVTHQRGSNQGSLFPTLIVRAHWCFPSISFCKHDVQVFRSTAVAGPNADRPRLSASALPAPTQTTQIACAPALRGTTLYVLLTCFRAGSSHVNRRMSAFRFRP